MDTGVDDQVTAGEGSRLGNNGDRRSRTLTARRGTRPRWHGALARNARFEGPVGFLVLHVDPAADAALHATHRQRQNGGVTGDKPDQRNRVSRRVMWTAGAGTQLVHLEEQRANHVSCVTPSHQSRQITRLEKQRSLEIRLRAFLGRSPDSLRRRQLFGVIRHLGAGMHLIPETRGLGR